MLQMIAGPGFHEHYAYIILGCLATHKPEIKMLALVSGIEGKFLHLDQGWANVDFSFTNEHKAINTSQYQVESEHKAITPPY